MEDILASIRRIIADDQSDAPPASGAGSRNSGHAPQGGGEAEHRATRETRWRSLDEIERETGGEQPHDLTEEVPGADDSPDGTRWYDEPAASAPQERGRYRDYSPPRDEDLAYGGDHNIDRAGDILELRDEDEVLELTEMVEEGEAVEAGTPSVLSLDEPLDDEPEIEEAVAVADPPPQSELPLDLTPDMELLDDSAADTETAPEARAAEDAGAMPMTGMFRENQKGGQPSPAVAQAFSRLRQTMASESDRRNEHRAEAAATQPELQANLEHLLRPMIKDWLDENLPQAVDRLVREEVSRVAKAPEND